MTIVARGLDRAGRARHYRRIVRGTALLLLAAVASGATAPPAPCRFAVPADLDATPAQWLGDCGNGTADGLGVIWAGSAEPYAFFAGRMAHGQPVDGLLLQRDGAMMIAVRFDAARRVVSSDGLRPQEDEHVVAQAQAAALDVAARFRKAGNTPSAAYYTRLARRIRDSQPE